MMKKILLLLCSVLLLSSCGVGSYSVSSGKADEAYISFTAASNIGITVTIDGSIYELKAVKDKQYKADRKIKKTAQNTLTLTPGTHEVTVRGNGQQLFSKKLYISAQEHKIIEL